MVRQWQPYSPEAINKSVHDGRDLAHHHRDNAQVPPDGVTVPEELATRDKGKWGPTADPEGEHDEQLL